MILPHLVVGGGLAGITIAVGLARRGLDFLLLEASGRLGGKIETRLTPDACYEFGPNSFSNQSDEIFTLLSQVGLTPEILEPSPASRHRYILKKGEIVPLPGKPPQILTTRALSFRGKLRFLRELCYVSPRKADEESVWEFFARHFGREVADYFADPFVSGIFAGDPENLSLQSAFPTMFEAEKKCPSLIRYLMRERKTAKSTPQSYQLKRGLESIFHEARLKIGEEKIRFSEKVVEIVSEGASIKVMTDRGEYQAKTLYLTTPAYIAAPCLRRALPQASRALEQIHYAPVATAHLKVSKEESFPFDGFGILLPSLEKRKILGVLWNSSTFPPLFPDKSHHYITVYVGGMRNPDLVQADESRLREIICQEVQELFSLKDIPTFIQLKRHPRAIPQYRLGYGKIVEALNDSLASYPSLKLAGNYLGGISIPKTVAYAMEVARS